VVAVITLLIVILLSLLVTRVATVLLASTGLSREAAGFQARSAFTGSGFTTSESEAVVNHPVRRRVIHSLMLFGSAGVVAVIAGVVISFSEESGGEQWLVRLLVVAAVLFVLWRGSKIAWVDRQLVRLIERGLSRYTDIPASDHVRLLDLAGTYSVLELHVQPGDWVADHTLRELALRDEGIAVLGVQPSQGTYLGVPNGETVLRAGDSLILYGRRAELAALDQRRAGPDGDRAHAEGVRRQSEGATTAPDNAPGGPAET
jgi:hypothetical protein